MLYPATIADWSGTVKEHLSYKFKEELSWIKCIVLFPEYQTKLHIFNTVESTLN